MTSTPPFIRWSLERPCALREDADITSPEATERQLRVLRSYSDAVHDGRVRDGICFAPDEDGGPEYGFRAADVLEVYGGEEFVRSQCDACPSNTIAGRSGSALAGCFGLIVLDDPLRELLSRPAWIERVHAVFLPTNPAWFGLWANSPFAQPQLELLAELFAEVPGRQRGEFHVQSFPAGEFDARSWIIHAHCPRCKGPMSEREHRCAVCGLVCHAEPERRRKPRGRRPFVPLKTFLGEAKAKKLLDEISCSPLPEAGREAY
jgi:hypothetical protein